MCNCQVLCTHSLYLGNQNVLGFCRNTSIISGFCFVAPALPSASSSSKTNNKRKNKSKDDGKKDIFIWRASLGQQLQRLYMRALLQNENAGVNYIRSSLQKRRDEVALGKLQVYADADQQVKQVSLHCFLPCSNCDSVK